MATAITSSILFNRSPSLSYSCPCSLSFNSIKRSQKVYLGGEGLILRISCLSEQNRGADPAESEPETTSRDSQPLNTPSSSSSSSFSVVDNEEETGISSYKWLVALGGVGFLETAYLTYLKLTNSEAVCPSGGVNCTTILTSPYSSVFGVPLPLIGMLAYGIVAGFGLQLSLKKTEFDPLRSTAETILIGTTTSMAAASAYFLYILNTKFSGETCLYCLISVLLSFSSFFITLKNSRSYEIQKMLGSQIFIAGLVAIALTASYNIAQPVSSSLEDVEIPYFETEISKESSPVAIALAKHLQSIGAKVYGAFWCSHCQEQKELFGREATKMLNYVECFPDGVMKGTKMAQACLDANLQGFPTWVINGQVLSGEKQFSELAELSGIQLEDLSQPN